VVTKGATGPGLREQADVFKAYLIDWLNRHVAQP
jgi:hypothetical protein